MGIEPRLPCRQASRVITILTELIQRNAAVSIKISKFKLLNSIRQVYKRRVIFFWDMTPFSLLEVHRRFGETYSFQFQNPRINHVTINQRKLRDETWTLLSFWSNDWFSLRSWRLHFSPKRRLTSTILHAVISQRAVFFIITAVTTSYTTIL